MRFPRHATNLLLINTPAPLGFRNASRRVVGFHDGGYVCRDLPLERSKDLSGHTHYIYGAVTACMENP